MTGYEDKIKLPKIKDLAILPALSSHSIINNFFHRWIFHSKHSLDKFFGERTRSVWALGQLLNLPGNLSDPLFSGDDCTVLGAYIAVANWYRPLHLRYVHAHNIIIVNIMAFIVSWRVSSWPLWKIYRACFHLEIIAWELAWMVCRGAKGLLDILRTAL